MNMKGATLTWLGHATVEITTAKGTTILVDPFLEQNPKFPKAYKFPEKLDLLLLTHAHSDHSADAVSMAAKYQPTVIAIVELAGWLESKGAKKVTGMNIGGSVQFQDVKISMVEARHSSSIEEDGKPIYAGDPAGYVLTIEGGPVVYLAGDTAVFSDMQIIRELYKPELALLPIGDFYTMGPEGAALAAKYLGVSTVVPIHYGTFPPLTGTPEMLEKLLKGTGTAIKKLDPGETLR